MFCKKCGNKLQDGANVCSICGTIAQGLNFYSTTLVDNEINEEKRPKNNKKKGVVLTVIICLLIVALGVGGIVFYMKNKTYEITGEWKSQDLMMLDSLVVQILVEDGGIDENVAEIIVGFLQLDKVEDVTFTFTPSGKILIGYKGETNNSIGDISYEKLNENKMTLSYDNEITVPIINVTIPLNFSKNVDYEVSKDMLTLYMYGKSIVFVRTNTPE